MRSPGWKPVVSFLFVWLMIGFALGTLVLVAIVPRLTNSMRAAGWSQSTEDLAMWAVIAVYIVASFLLSLVLVRWMRASRSAAVRLGVPAVATIFAVAALWGWMNPALYASVAGGGEEAALATESGALFVFGPYPDQDRLRELKSEGYAGVVSLQHPAVVPFEPQGIAAEKEAAAEVGIPFIHAPMLPWVSDNTESLDRILDLSREGTGKYYVHCGLGRDRTNVVRRMLQREGARVSDGSQMAAPRDFGLRQRPLERGWHKELERDVWLVPYPNEHEFYGNMLAGQVEHVALLLDPADTAQARWIRHTRDLMEQHDVDVSHHPLTPQRLGQAAALAARLQSLPRPLVIIAPFTQPHERSQVADAFEAAYDRLDGRVPPPPDRPATVARLTGQVVDDTHTAGAPDG